MVQDTVTAMTYSEAEGHFSCFNGNIARFNYSVFTHKLEITRRL